MLNNDQDVLRPQKQTITCKQIIHKLVEELNISYSCEIYS